MNKKGAVYCISLTFLFLALVSCNVKLDIPEKKMVAILVEMHMADGIIESYQAFEVRPYMDSTKVYRAILDKYGYTLEDFRGALNQYMKNPKVFESVYGNVTKELRKEQDKYAPEDKRLPVKIESMESFLYYETSVAGDTILIGW